MIIFPLLDMSADRKEQVEKRLNSNLVYLKIATKQNDSNQHKQARQLAQVYTCNDKQSQSQRNFE